MDQASRDDVSVSNQQQQQAANSTTTTTGSGAGSGSGIVKDAANFGSTEPLATQQLQDRAFTVLANHQLMLRYAIANDLSVPKVRVYFEKLAAGFEPTPIIKKWDVFDG